LYKPIFIPIPRSSAAGCAAASLTLEKTTSLWSTRVSQLEQKSGIEAIINAYLEAVEKKNLIRE